MTSIYEILKQRINTDDQVTVVLSNGKSIKGLIRDVDNSANNYVRMRSLSKRPKANVEHYIDLPSIILVSIPLDKKR